MEMKLAPLSLATALASRVLPQPGGPNRSTPDGEVSPMAANCCGCLMGCVIAKASSSRTCSDLVSHGGLLCIQDHGQAPLAAKALVSKASCTVCQGKGTNV